MTRLERLKDRRAQLFREWASMCQAKPTMAHQMKAQLAALDEEIEECEKYLPRALKDQMPVQRLDESHLLESMIKTHMAADFFCDAAMDFREKMNKEGFANCSLYPKIRQLEKLASEYAALICSPEFVGLQEFQCTNEALIEALHAKCDEYMAAHLQKVVADDHIKFNFVE